MAGITSCASCGTVIVESSTPAQEERKPCPSCGSIARSFLLKAETGTFKISAGIDAILEKVAIPLETLLIQTVIVPGEKTTEGQLIEAVTIPWFEIVSHIVEDPTAIFQISPRKLEEIIAGAYKKARWDEVILTPRSGDRGRDVIAVKRGIGTVRVIEEVKAYGPGHLVTAKNVRALIGVLHGDHVSKGFLSTTSNFAPRITEDQSIMSFVPSRLELINGEMLLRRLEELAKK